MVVKYQKQIINIIHKIRRRLNLIKPFSLKILILILLVHIKMVFVRHNIKYSFIMDYILGSLTFGWAISGISDRKFFRIMYSFVKHAEDQRRRELRLTALLELVKINYNYIVKFLPEIELLFIESLGLEKTNSKNLYPLSNLFNSYNNKKITEKIRFLYTGSIYEKESFILLVLKESGDTKWSFLKCMKVSFSLKIKPN